MSLRPPRNSIGSSKDDDHGISSHRYGEREAAQLIPRWCTGYPAFFARADVRAGLSAFLAGALVSSLASRLPLIGSSISRWPSMRLRGFLPLAAGGGGADCFSFARLRFSASIRLMTLPADFGAAFAVVGMPLRFWLMRSISADS